MFKKIVLFIIFILILLASLTLYFVKTIDVDELNLNFSIYEEGNLLIYSSEYDLLGSFKCLSDNCYLSYSVSETLLDNITITDESKKSINMTVPVMGIYAFINDGGLINLVNLESSEIIYSYRSVKYYNENYILLKDEANKWALAYFNESGLTFITDFIYDYIGKSEYSDNYLVLENEDYYLINYSGNKVSDIFENVFNYSNEEIIVKTDSYYYLYGYDGNLIINENFSMIKLSDNYIFTAQNNLLNVYDKNYSKINEDFINLGVIVNWSSYYVYNEDYKFLYEDSIFTIKEEDDSLIIYANDNETLISLN